MRGADIRWRRVRVVVFAIAHALFLRQRIRA
jgi:hypothetical protein